MKRSETAIHAGFGLALAILALIGFLYYRNVTAMTDFDRMVERSTAVIAELDGLVSAMEAVEIGELTFILTADETVLVPYRAALGRIDRHLAQLKNLTRNHPSQQGRVQRVEPLIREKLAEVGKTMDARKTAGFRTAYALEFTPRHERLMDEIRRQLAEARDAVMRHLNTRKALKDASTRKTIVAFFAGNGIGFVLLMSTFLLLKKEISVRKRAELKFRGVLESAPDAVVIVDDSGAIRIVNSQAEKLFGYEREELYGQQVELLVPERFRTDHAAHRAGFLRNPHVRHMGAAPELYGQHKGGHEFPADISLSPLVTDEGVLVIASIRDTTERTRAEEALRKSERKFSKIFHAVPALIGISTLKEGRFIDVNQAAAETLGYQREELIGRTSRELGLWEDEFERVRITQMMKEQGSVRNVEVRYRGKSGEHHVGLYSAEFVDFNGGNGDRYMLSLVKDITLRKRAEEEVERLNATLAARADELETVNRELEAFNYTVAHDLRQPLNTVGSYCQVIEALCGATLDEKCRGYLRETYNGTMRMNRLIEALLMFSRMARVELRRERVDISEIARETAAELRLTDPVRRVAFRINDGMEIDGDANLLRVIMDNLLGNAWKYTTTREEGIIEFGVTERDGTPAFFVRDNGVGFAMADADKLFIPFQRLPGAEEWRGFGIGLATVERIIRRHGGRVWAEGEPDKGATFYFTLPPRDVP